MNRIGLGSLALVVALAGTAFGQTAPSGDTANSAAQAQTHALPQTTTTLPGPDTSSANVNNSANVRGHEYAANPAPQDSQSSAAAAGNTPSDSTPPSDQDATRPQGSGPTSSR